MISFLIKNQLVECSEEELQKHSAPYVVIVNSKEWAEKCEQFDIGIDIEPEISDIYVSEANPNYDAITGTFCIPDRMQLDYDRKFAFVLDEKGIIFIDNGKSAEKITRTIMNLRRWHIPSLERFLYDFLNQIVQGDIRMLENYEKEMRKMENDIINDNSDKLTSDNVSKLRNNLQTLKEHYEQLQDVTQVFAANENDFFKTENLRYFNMFLDHIDRLAQKDSGLLDYTASIRELYTTHLDIQQNKIMTILTVVTSIFTPLTLITGWYGMNFKYMPELGNRYGYITVIGVSIFIVVICAIFFVVLYKKKKFF